MRIMISFLMIMMFTFSLTAQEDSVVKITGFKNLYRYQNFFIAGQPPVEELEWLKSQGVRHIINLRTEEENREVKATAYDEQAWCDKLGFSYDVIPVNGLEGYTPENLEKFIAAINKNEKTLIHCRSGRRANDFFMAYLIEHDGYSVEEATAIGRQIRFVIPLEKILDMQFFLGKP
ncbi:MAG: hypothetical protein GXO86_02650 [Chlorobi bacterium]|nr:hypothetical protein [Chlorobiota bacterium]